MKKQEAKKSTKWILLAAGLVVLLALVGLLLVMCTGGQGNSQTDPAGTGEVADIYWNIDRELYAGKSDAGLSSREKADDGYYHIMFAIDGEQVEYKTTDTKVVNRIDNLKVMGLVFDDAGLITDVLEVDEFTGGIVADEFYVQEVMDGMFICNSSESLNGMSLELEITADTKIYDVSPKAEVIGAPSPLAPADRVIAIQDEAGRITHIFIVSRLEKSEIYWNVERQYDYTNKKTNRVPDENGDYVFLLAVNGEQKIFKTKSEAVATQMDMNSARCFGLLFDEDGYISQYLTAAKVTGGVTFGSWYDVTDISGVTVTVERILPDSSQGTVVTANMIEDCQIYDVTGYMPEEVFVGQRTDLRVGDRIHGLRNAKGDVVCIYVVHRLVPGAQVIWNIDRSTYWSSQLKTSLRKPNADGYYEFRVAHEGQQRILKTKDKALVDKIDGNYAARTLAVLLDGDEITHAMSVAAAIGYAGSFASWYDVTQIQGAVVQTQRIISGSDQGNTAMGILAPNVKVYNVSTAYENYQGEPTTLQVGDRIHGWKEPYGNVLYIFVVNRVIDSEIYYNVDRNYDSTNKVTKRSPDWDGYYRIRLAVNGKHVTYKTKDKEVVDQLDSYRYMGLILDGDIIKRAVSTSNVKGYTGGAIFDWGDVVSISGNEVRVKKMSAAFNTGEEWTATLAEGYEVFDVSTYSSFIGKKTSLNIGDRVVGLRNGDGEVSLIYVMYKNTHKYGSKWSAYKWCDHCDQYVYWQPWSGNSIAGYYNSSSGKLVKSSGTHGHFYVAADLDLKGVKVIGGDSEDSKYKNLDVVLDLNGYTVTSTDRVFLVCGGSDLTIVDLSGEDDGTLIGMGQSYTTNKDGTKDYKFSGTIQLYQEGSSLTLNTGTIALAEEHNVIKGGGCVNVGTKTTFTMNGGQLIGGDIVTSYKAETDSSTCYGGAVYCRGTFNMNGGTVVGGMARYGGSVYVFSGVMNMHGGTVTGGVAAVDEEMTVLGGGGNILLASGALYMDGGLIEDGVTTGKGGNILSWDTSVIEVSGDAVITHGSAVSAGGNISADKGTTMSVSGNAKIVEGMSPTGSSIYLYDGGETEKPILNLSGKPTVELALNGIKATVDGLEEGASITMETAGIFTDGTVEASDEAYKNYFHSTIEGCGVQVIDGALGIYSAELYCECAGTLEGVEGHTCVPELWAPWSSVTTVPTDPGNYFLVNDVETNSQGSLPVDVTVKLDLNGHTVKGSNRIYSMFTYVDTNGNGEPDTFLDGNGRLVITDSSANRDGQIISARTQNTSEQGAVIFAEDGHVILYAGTIDATAANTTHSRGGAGIYIGPDKTFTMYGGKVIGGTATNYGGAVYLYTNADMYMYGGEITGGNAKSGGNVYAYKGEINVYGGTIDKGVATNGGGNILLASATLNQLGGTIQNGEASSGGNIHAWDTSAVNIGGGDTAALLTAGKATKGGNFYADKDTEITISMNGAVSDGTATYGGNFYLDQAYSNTEKKNEAGEAKRIYRTYLAPTLAVNEGGLISGGTATNSGGAIYCRGYSRIDSKGEKTDVPTVILNGGSIGKDNGDGTYSAGTADRWGGNIYIYGPADVVINAGAIQGGSVTNTTGKTTQGGNIFAESYKSNDVYYIYDYDETSGLALSTKTDFCPMGTPTVSLLGEDAVIKDGKSMNYRAGNVAMALNSAHRNAPLADTEADLVMTAGEISGGEVTGTAGNIYLSGARFNMSGGKVIGGTAKSGGQATANGGSIVVTSSGEMNMSGDAEVTGGHAANVAGNMQVQGKLTMKDNAKITDGMLGSSKNMSGENSNLQVNQGILIMEDNALINGGVSTYASDTGTDKVSVTLKDQVTIAGQSNGLTIGTNDTNTIDATGLTNGALVKINATYNSSKGTTVDRVIAQGLTVEQTGFFLSTRSGYSAVIEAADGATYKAGDLHLAEGHIHCICGGLLAGIEGDDHECELVTFEELPAPPSGSTTVTTEDGKSYYLPKDVEYFINSSSKNVDLCLNGHSITRTDRAVGLYGSASAPGSMTITDHAFVDAEGNRTYAGEIIGGGMNQDNGGVVFAQAGQTLNIYGGNFSCNATDTQKTVSGGIVYSSGTLNLYDGVITGTNVYKKPDTTTSRGGAIHASTFNMFGGKVIGGSAEQHGAVVNVSKVFTMTGGLIDGTGSVAGKSGGTISLMGDTATISGGKIIGGTATEKGGIIWAWSIELIISGDAELVAGVASAEDMGTAICIDGNASDGYSELTITGGKITGTVSSTTKDNTITVGEKAYVENIIIKAADQKVAVNALAEGANVTITAADDLLANGPIVVATGVTANNLPYIHCAQGYEMRDDGAGNLYLAKAGATAAILSIDATEEATEAATEATEAATEATEAATEETQAATEETQAATEETQAATEATIEATQAATEAAATESAAQ